MNDYKRLMNELHTLNNTMVAFLQRIVTIVEKDEALRESLEPAKPIESEYRAGEWVPEINGIYFCIWNNGTIHSTKNNDTEFDRNQLKIGNASPTKAIAEAAKAHADWWREFDMSDEGGTFAAWIRSPNHVTVSESWAIDATPRYKTEANARAAIERLGGEQKVIEMLTRGRVFKFKWGEK